MENGRSLTVFAQGIGGYSLLSMIIAKLPDFEEKSPQKVQAHTVKTGIKNRFVTKSQGASIFSMVCFLKSGSVQRF
jgi:hypothetical protein